MYSTVVSQAILPQEAAAAANAACRGYFVTSPTCCYSAAFDADEPRRWMAAVLGNASRGVKPLHCFGRVGWQFVQ